MSIGSCFPFIPRLFHTHFGGSLREVRGKNEGWRNSIRWEICGKTAYDFLLLMEPYLTEKKEQVEKLIEAYEAGPNTEARSDALEQVQLLKRVEHIDV